MTDAQIQTAIAEILSLNEALRREVGATRWVRHERVADLQREISIEFGARNGWTRARRRFNLFALRNRRMADNRKWEDRARDEPPHSYFDHSYFYRTPDKRAAAIAVHLYDVPKDIDQWADERGLKVLRPDFPSWWYPGKTALIVYVAKEELF